MRASAITELRVAAFKVTFELPLLALSFDARDFFPPFREVDVPPDFRTSVVFLSSFEDFSLPLALEVGDGKLEFGKGKAIKKVIFNRIASEFNSIFTDVKVTGEHCIRKLLKLEEEENGPQQHHGSRQVLYRGESKCTTKLHFGEQQQHR